MLNNKDWEFIERPSYSGKHRNERHKRYDEEYGKGNWRIVWQLRNGLILDFLGICALYEDAYHEFLLIHPTVLDQLINEASNVYDDEPNNVESGLNYLNQETIRTHIQDIAIRNSLIRMGKWFQGEELIRIRDVKGTHPFSMTLSPGRVPFHLKALIKKPEVEGWWKPGSVEAFYQSAKIFQVRKK